MQHNVAQIHAFRGIWSEWVSERVIEWMYFVVNANCYCLESSSAAALDFILCCSSYLCLLCFVLSYFFLFFCNHNAISLIFLSLSSRFFSICMFSGSQWRWMPREKAQIDCTHEQTRKKKPISLFHVCLQTHATEC